MKHSASTSRQIQSGDSQKMTLGLTGGIGCGKSSILPVFEKVGFATINADKIASEIHTTPEMFRFLQERFGNSVVSTNGEILKKELAALVFSNKSALADLENFMHPRIHAEWKKRIVAAPEENVVVEVPLLFEKNYECEFDATSCIVSSPAVQLARLEARGLSREQARVRIAAQLPLSEKIRRADIVIFNDGSRDFLEHQVREITKHFKTLKK